MKDKNHAKLLLKLAERDLNALQGMVNDKVNFDDSVFGFHAQQAVEKTLKAILSLHRIEFKKTHDITEYSCYLKKKKVN